MWCKHCQQDVPGIADGEGGVDCARCGSIIRLPAAAETAAAGIFVDRLDATTSLDPPSTDTWQLDQQLAEAERLLKAFTPLTAPDQSWHAGTGPSLDGRQLRVGPTVHHGTAALPIELQSGGGVFAWLFLLCGTMGLVCGGVLVGWSLYASRTALWNLGLPILLGGQAALLLGIVLQVVRIVNNHRVATQRLAQVDRQLGDLQQTTTLLGNSYGPGSSTFFTHLAEGANPHMLLADLKGQIDLLAMKVARK